MCGIAIVRSLSFLFLDEFDGNAYFSVTIKSGSTVVICSRSLGYS